MSLETDILPYIPQRSPFVMVDTLEHCDDNGAVTKFVIKIDNIFIRNGNLTEPALIENIAQTAAAHKGRLCSEQNKPVPIGFIGAVENLKISKLPKIGDTLYSTVTIINQVLNATIIAGKIVVNGNELASCKMKIFVQ